MQNWTKWPPQTHPTVIFVLKMFYTLHSSRFSFSCTDFGSIAVRVFFVFSGLIIWPDVKLWRRARINGISKIALDSQIWIIRWIFGLKSFDRSFVVRSGSVTYRVLGSGFLPHTAIAGIRTDWNVLMYSETVPFRFPFWMTSFAR